MGEGREEIRRTRPHDRQMRHTHTIQKHTRAQTHTHTHTPTPHIDTRGAVYRAGRSGVGKGEGEGLGDGESERRDGEGGGTQAIRDTHTDTDRRVAHSV